MIVNPYHYNRPTRRYRIQQAMFSIADHFRIQDEFGQDVFTVRSKMFSMSDKLLLEDMAGNGLIKIRQEILNFQPTYHLLSAFPADYDRPIGTIKKQFALLQHKFVIESIYGVYTLESLDIFAHSYTLIKYGRVVATVSKQLFALSDTYGVEIVADEDHAFILAVVIVLDQVIFDTEQTMYF